MEKKVHFIAIGGSAMHNLALALQKKGYIISGSDDEIFEPSRTRLKNAGILPAEYGWFPEKITSDLETVILGMHARKDNPELQRARELGLTICSYPEFLYEQGKNKIRIVIGGSHGKTTITSMIMHVFRNSDVKFDYMVGAQVEGFETMVSLSEEARFMILEGDEYLSSPDDPRPKFHLYKPQIALLSGIAWDHINVFPTFENYVEQFRIFAGMIQAGGTLVWYQHDRELQSIASMLRSDIQNLPYSTHPYCIEDGKSCLLHGSEKVPVAVFGQHNMANIGGALEICRLAGIRDELFYHAIPTFTGAGKRLQKLGDKNGTIVYLDFAHSPSKVKATIDAVREQYPDKKVIACLELHTFSSLKSDFLPQYKNSMNKADKAIVYYNPHTIELKRLEPVNPEQVAEAFGNENLQVGTNSFHFMKEVENTDLENTILLLMSSGNFDGIEFKSWVDKLLAGLKE